MIRNLRAKLAAFAAGLGFACLTAALAQTTVPITGLPSAGTLTGSEVFPAVQGGTTVQASVNQVATLIQSINNTWTGTNLFNAAVSLAAPLTSSSSVVVGSPTGGACGTGCLNAAKIEINGSQIVSGISTLTLATPPWLNVTGSPCTTAICALTLSSPSVGANMVLAGPSASSGAITARLLTSADIPAASLTTSANGGTTGVLTATKGGTGLAGTITGIPYANGTGAYTATTAAQISGTYASASAACFLRGDGACTNGIVNALAASGGSVTTTGITTVMAGSPGPGNGFRVYDGLNAWWNGSNWTTGTDGASNGAGLIATSYGSGDLEFYVIPDTGGTNQTISENAIGGYAAMALTSGGASINNALTVNGIANHAVATFASGSSATEAIGDVQITRAGSTGNEIGAGPSLQLSDTANQNGSMIQNSGGQTEFWQEEGNSPSVWNQTAYVDSGYEWHFNHAVAVAGNSTFSNSLTVAGTSTLAALSATTGSFSGTVTAPTFSGSVSGGSASVTTLTASGTVSLTGLGSSAGADYICIASSGDQLSYSSTGCTSTPPATLAGANTFTGANTFSGAVSLPAPASVTIGGQAIAHLGQQSITESSNITLSSSSCGDYVRAGSITITVPTITLPISGYTCTVVVAVGAGIVATLSQGSGAAMYWAGQGGAPTLTISNEGLVTLTTADGINWIVSGAGLAT